MINVEDKTNLASTPLQDQRQCTRNSLCKAAGCQVCAIPGGETYYVWDLTNFLEETTNPKVPKPKPPAPLDHIIHDLVEGFQEGMDSNDISGIKLVLDQLILAGTTCTDFLKYNLTELTSLKITTEKMVASIIQPPFNSIVQQPQHIH